MAVTLDFFEPPPYAQTCRFRDWRALRTLDGAFEWNARVYVLGHRLLEPGGVYTVAELARDYGLSLKDGRPFLPPLRGLTSMPFRVRFVVEPIT